MAKFYITGPDIEMTEGIEAIDRVDAFLKSGLSSVYGITVWTEAEWNEPMMLQVREQIQRQKESMQEALRKDSA